MKIKTLVSVLIIVATHVFSPVAKADRCFQLVSARSLKAGTSLPAHFVLTEEFNSNPMNPDYQKMSPAQIVITSGLAKELLNGSSKVIRAYVVINLTYYSEVQFVAFLKRVYGLEAIFLPKIILGFQDIRLIGPASKILNFLSNPYALKNVYWAGKSAGLESYTDRISPYFEVSSDFQSFGSWGPQ